MHVKHNVNNISASVVEVCLVLVCSPWVKQGAPVPVILISVNSKAGITKGGITELFRPGFSKT